ncbi:PDZ and LIM domain protein Zasp [Echinococcus multilocularis]|uniref:PDZ and LIM domain protein Zasp n=1 Tax=Echinococcus multilocularis TaxID=6211 RepID=A0A068YEI9_ECHMU|nr:PDZ and LIM domain protein Zasp [Echinococcus multilocularis]
MGSPHRSSPVAKANKVERKTKRSPTLPSPYTHTYIRKEKSILSDDVARTCDLHQYNYTYQALTLPRFAFPRLAFAFAWTRKFSSAWIHLRIMSTEPVVYQLRRPSSDKSWGFVLQGGADQGLPVFVHKITRNGIAHRAGLEPGDVIVKICKTPLSGMSHSQVKAELLRAGSDLDFTVLKRAFNVTNYNMSMKMMAAEQSSPTVAQGGPEERSEIVEEHLWRHGGPTFKNVQPKSYKILEQQLPQSEMGVPEYANQTGGSGPGSVFERSVDERSPYLKATEQTIQKAYGES